MHIWDEWFDEVYPPLEDDQPLQRQVTPPVRELETPPAPVPEAVTKVEEERKSLSSGPTAEQLIELPEQIDIILEDVAVEEREEIAAVIWDKEI